MSGTAFRDFAPQGSVYDSLALSLNDGRFSHATLITGPRGVGKRSLAACNDTRRSVSIMYASRATKEAMTDSMRRFSDCVRTGRFFAWERTARCGEFAFTIQFENGGMVYARVLLDVMDYFRDRVDLNYLLQPEGFFSLDDKRAFLVTDEQTDEYMNEVGETDMAKVREIIGKAHQEVEDIIYRTFNKCMTEGNLDAD